MNSVIIILIVATTELITPSYGENDVAVLFDGQGVLEPGAGEDLYNRYAAFREVMDHSSDLVGADLARICFGDLTYLQETPLGQPATVAFDLAEYAVYRELNGEGAVTAGLSLGNFASMGAAGVFESYAHAVHASAIRARLIHEHSSGGKMAGVVGLALHEIEPMTKRAGAGIAVIRDRVRKSIVVTGGDDEVDAVEKDARERGVRRWEPLSVLNALHFRHQEQVKDPFEVEIRKKFTLRDPHLMRLIGNNALYLDTLDTSIFHSRELLTETSDWDATIVALNDQGIKIVFEAGPDSTKGLARQMSKRFGTKKAELPFVG